MSLEASELLGSKGKIKIIKILAMLGEANITRIAREARLHHRAVEKHLRELVRAGLVEERKLGRLRLFSLRLDNPKVLVVLELIRTLEEGA